MKRENILELCVWSLILIIIFSVVFINYRNYNIKNTTTLHFTDIDGIVKGSPVRFLGVVIGHVKDIKYKDGVMDVKIIVTKENVTIPKGSTAKVEFTGLAGSKSIEIEPPINNNAEDIQIITQSPMRIKDIFEGSRTYVEALMSIEGQIKLMPMQNIYSVLDKTTQKYDWNSFDVAMDKITKELKRENGFIRKITDTNELLNNQIDKINNLLLR